MNVRGLPPPRVFPAAAVAGLRASSLRALRLLDAGARTTGSRALSSRRASATPGLRQGALRVDFDPPGVRNSGAVATGAMSDLPATAPEGAPATGGDRASRPIAGSARETPKTIAPSDAPVGGGGEGERRRVRARSCSRTIPRDAGPDVSAPSRGKRRRCGVQCARGGSARPRRTGGNKKTQVTVERGVGGGGRRRRGARVVSHTDRTVVPVTNFGEKSSTLVFQS